ncbi:hypothetical protein TNIN_84151 [Trichonephila inaurata madagascariensis]|uniref:Uncharacterized protein n=1 Tax=Trichonephila inaurata madagascariensis TaxID=2747483 RepID=A0A8X7BQ90_9ARAC|nr:hypothetical protein TNIN_84151 [Trichonephila inaurata madagascariensis]
MPVRMQGKRRGIYIHPPKDLEEVSSHGRSSSLGSNGKSLSPLVNPYIGGTIEAPQGWGMFYLDSQREQIDRGSLLDHPEGRRLCYPDSLLPRGPALEKSPDDRPLSRKSNELRIGQNSGG